MKAAISIPTAEPRPLDRPATDLPPPRPESGRVDLLARLESICADHGLAGLAGRLHDLAEFVGVDMASFEEEFARLPRSERVTSRGASHLLDLGGKRLRPMCLALASRVGDGFDRRALDLAVAVELVHAATLLHDDVVDLGDVRRGAAATRVVYGNAASIFAGDWLLVEALRRVHRADLPGLLERLFALIEEMIVAESLQLESRGKLSIDRRLYFEVVEGKTASVFRWAMTAGAMAGGVGEAERRALERYGQHLGIAFQATDDLLDLTGDVLVTGKELFADLREGKMTYPLIVAMERDPDLRPVIRRAVHAAEDTIPEAVSRRVVRALRETRAVEDCLELARDHCALALEALEDLPPSRARRALETVAESLVDRDL